MCGGDIAGRGVRLCERRGVLVVRVDICSG